MHSHDLLKTRTDDLATFLSEELSDQVIFELAHSTLYHRGQQYYEEGAVIAADFHSQNEITATVAGSRDYRVRVSLKEHQLSASCTCPYDGVCKHIIALLLHLLSEEVEGQEAPETKEHFQAYLSQCSKKELIAMVHRFAPNAFKEQIRNGHLSADQSLKIIEKNIKKIMLLFDDQALLLEPGDFEQALEEPLDSLKGFGEEHAERIFELIVTMFERIEEAQDEGYLYNNYYDEVFEGESVVRFVRDFLSNLPCTMKIDFLNQLTTLVEGSNYGTFDDLFSAPQQLFSKDDAATLKPWLLSSVAQGNYSNIDLYYGIVAPALTVEEKFLVLRSGRPMSTSLSLSLAELHEAQKAWDSAITVLEKAKDNNKDYWEHKEPVLHRLLALKVADKSLDRAFANEMLKELPNKNVLSQLIAYLPKCRKGLESKLRSKNKAEFLDYLTEADRLEEALEMVLTKSTLWEERRYAFFRRYKNEFKEEAKAYFLKRIDNNLAHSNNDHYAIVADTLTSLKQIAPAKAQEVKQAIVQTYHRRRNLIALLK